MAQSPLVWHPRLLSWNSTACFYANTVRLGRVQGGQRSLPKTEPPRLQEPVHKLWLSDSMEEKMPQTSVTQSDDNIFKVCKAWNRPQHMTPKPMHDVGNARCTCRIMMDHAGFHFIHFTHRTLSLAGYCIGTAGASTLLGGETAVWKHCGAPKKTSYPLCTGIWQKKPIERILKTCTYNVTMTYNH